MIRVGRLLNRWAMMPGQVLLEWMLMTKNSQGMPKYPTDYQKDMGRSSAWIPLRFP